MTKHEAEALRRLKRASLPPATASKRLVRDLPADETFELSPRQSAFLHFIEHRFRRQLNGFHVCSARCASYRYGVQIGRRQVVVSMPSPPAGDVLADLPLFAREIEEKLANTDVYDSAFVRD